MDKVKVKILYSEKTTEEEVDVVIWEFYKTITGIDLQPSEVIITNGPSDWNNWTTAIRCAQLHKELMNKHTEIIQRELVKLEQQLTASF